MLEGLELDYKALSFWWRTLQDILIVITVIYAIFLNRTKVNKDAIDALGKKVAEEIAKHDKRVALLDTEVRSLPGHQEIGEIHEKINNVGQGVSSVEGQLKSINNTLGLINTHLINKEK